MSSLLNERVSNWHAFNNRTHNKYPKKKQDKY